MGAVRNTIAIAAIAAVALLATACGNPQATFERVVRGDPAKPYLGKTKEEIIACAGEPAGSYPHGSGETLTYHYSGAGPGPGEAKPKTADDDAKPGFFGTKKQDKNWKCAASVVFENGRLTRLTFAPRDAISPYAMKKNAKTGEKTPMPQPEPCTFVLPKCGG